MLLVSYDAWNKCSEQISCFYPLRNMLLDTNAAVRRRKKGGLTQAGGTFTIPAEGTAAIFPN